MSAIRRRCCRMCSVDLEFSLCWKFVVAAAADCREKEGRHRGESQGHRTYNRRFPMTAFRLAVAAFLVFTTSVAAEQRGAKPAPAKAAAPQFFTTPLTLDQMRNKQAVIETDLGTIVIDLLADAAPNHVGFFIKNAQDG